MASPDELLAMLEEAAEEAEHAQNQVFENEYEFDLQETLEELMMELIDEASLGVCFEVHRACKIGTYMLDEANDEIDQMYGEYAVKRPYEIVQEKGRDVFGQVPMKKQLECVCPNCSRNLAASRFAPHLEKCMGMGRTSSRVASRRIAKSGKKDSDNESDDNDDNDNEWNYTNDRKVKKLRRDRSTHSPRRGKNSKSKAASLLDRSSDIPSVGSNASDGSGNNLPVYEGLGKEERRNLLSQTCGVISEHTKKMCTRSHRCPQHSDDQRKAVRVQLLGSAGLDDDVHVDIDTYEEGDSQALRDSLQWDRISNPSPADSNSTNNSTGTTSRKKKGSKSNKKKGSKSANSTGVSTPNSLYDFV